MNTYDSLQTNVKIEVPRAQLRASLIFASVRWSSACNCAIMRLFEFNARRIHHSATKKSRYSRMRWIAGAGIFLVSSFALGALPTPVADIGHDHDFDWALLRTCLPLIILVCLTPFAFLIDTRNSRRANAKAIACAINKLNIIHNGALYLGSESESVVHRDVDGLIDQLCRTKNGNWFTVKYNPEEGADAWLDFNPCSEKEAVRRLERIPEEYIRFFGLPNIA